MNRVAESWIRNEFPSSSSSTYVTFIRLRSDNRILAGKVRRGFDQSQWVGIVSNDYCDLEYYVAPTIELAKFYVDLRLAELGWEVENIFDLE